MRAARGTSDDRGPSQHVAHELVARLIDDARVWAPLAHADTEGLTEEQITRWSNAIDPHQLGLIGQRLAWATRPSGSKTDPGRPSAGPTWWLMLESIRAACTAGPNLGVPHPARWLPFSDVFWPIAEHAWIEITLRGPDAAAALNPAAVTDLQVALMVRLSELAAPSLGVLFGEMRTLAEIVARKSVGDVSYQPPQRSYKAFCEEQLSTGLAPLLLRFPVLARLLATATRQWIDRFTECLSRVHLDRGDLEQSLHVPRTAQVVRVSTDRSDAHEDGRRVQILTFDGGQRVVYKAKDLGLDALFNRVLTEISKRLPGALSSANVLTRGGDYGYVQFAQFDAPLGKEIPTLYRNAGRLLGVLYLLGASDCHYENVIVQGPNLVVIDLETLFEARLSLDGTPHDEETDHELHDSVLRTDLLPSWLSFEGQEAVDVSGLAAMYPRQSVLSRRLGHWVDVNTDDMLWGPGPDLQEAFNVRADLERGQEWRALHSTHCESIVAGFAEIYTLCRQPDLRERLHQLIAEAQGLTRRVVLRPTRIYSSVQANALSPNALTQRFERALRLEQLSRSYLGEDQSPDAAALFAAEVQSIEQLDIPRFMQRIGQTDMYVAGGVVLESAFDVDGLHAAQARLEGLSDDGLGWQVRLIRGAIHAGASTPETPFVAPTPGSPPQGMAARRTPAQMLAETVLNRQDGHLTWLTSIVTDAGSRQRIGLLPDGLYDGRAGVAAFLYAAGARDLADRCMAPLIGSLTDGSIHDQSVYVRDMGMGLTGVGGILRAFLFLEKIGGPDRPWIEHAAQLASLVTPKTIAREKEADLVSGIAGLAKPLADLYRMGHCEVVAPLLEALGQALLTARDPTTGAWRTRSDGVPLTGLAHGASGISAALAEIAAVTGSEEALDAALSGLDYEQRVFAATGGWADLRRPGREPGFMHAWCHGSIGIALARSRICEILPDRLERREWENQLGVGVEQGLAAPPSTKDHLCCGNLGRTAVISHLGRRHDRADWVMAAPNLKMAGGRTFEAWGEFRAVTVDPYSGVVPGLMTGLAGIGMLAQDIGSADWVESLLI